MLILMFEKDYFVFLYFLVYKRLPSANINGIFILGCKCSYYFLCMQINSVEISDGF
nr:MAG TPA: hypothetical protein [Caudoviricetes sp.]